MIKLKYLKDFFLQYFTLNLSLNVIKTNFKLISYIKKNLIINEK